MTRLIDADKLKTIKIYALVNDKENKNGVAFAPMCCVLKGDIDNAPTVDLSAKWAEAHSTGYDVGYTKGLEDGRQKGEWVDDDGVPKCPFCKTPAFFHYGFELTNFCSVCGADLRRGQKNE